MGKMVFCLFISTDFMQRFGIFIVLMRYYPQLIWSKAVNYCLFVIFVILTETMTYFVFLCCICVPYKDDLKNKYNKFQIALMILVSVITVTPFYNDCTQTNVNYKKKLFVLSFNMIFRLMLMSMMIFLLLYLTDFTLTIVQKVILVSFGCIQFGLIVYSTNIILKCERLIQIAEEKTKSQSIVQP